MAEQENQMEMNEFQFPDEVNENEATSAEEEFEVEDDTPEEDRDREPLPEDVVKELDADELNDYSERVRTRMSQMKKVWHDERRAKESAAREREEALRVAQQILEENKRLKMTLSQGEEYLMQTMKEAAEREFEIAKREYKDAYDAGDTERVISAQERLTNAQFKLQQATGYRPVYVSQKQNTGQEQQISVNTEYERPQVPRPDTKAMAWQERNPWFGSDEEMTSLALGLHEKLVKNGVDPRSDDYYRRIDSTMRKRFPDYFGGTQEQAKPTPRAKAATVVAPATRSTAPKKIVLTKTQVNLAKKLGITPEQYARELMKENRNG